MFGKLMFTTARALALSLGLVPAASAATVFEFGDSGLGPTGITAPALGFETDGIAVTVTGARRDDCVLLVFDCRFARERVSQNSIGLGVFGGFPDSRELDGQVDEVLSFSFDRAVRLISIGFSFIDGDDAYDVFVGSGADVRRVADDALQNPFRFGPDEVDDVVQIFVDGNASAFRVTQLTVAAIPLPAAGWLMLAGLGGLALVRRRRG